MVARLVSLVPWLQGHHDKNKKVTWTWAHFGNCHDTYREKENDRRHNLCERRLDLTRVKWAKISVSNQKLKLHDTNLKVLRSSLNAVFVFVSHLTRNKNGLSECADIKAWKTSQKRHRYWMWTICNFSGRSIINKQTTLRIYLSCKIGNVK